MMKKVLWALAVLIGLTAPDLALAQDTKEIAIVSTGGPGSGNSILTNIVKTALRKVGRPSTVHDLPGAGGRVALKTIALAPADGYTIGVLGDGNTMVLVPADEIAGESLLGGRLKPIMTIGDTYLELVARKSLLTEPSFENFLKEGKRRNKAKEKNLQCGWYGPNGGLAMAVLAGYMAEVEAEIHLILYQDAGFLMLSLERGEVDCIVVAVSSTLLSMAERAVPVLGTFGQRKDPFLPSSRLLAELGCAPCGNITAGYGVFGPKDMSSQTVALLRGLIGEALKDEEAKALLKLNGVDPRTSTLEDYTKEVEKRSDNTKRFLCETRINLSERKNPFANCPAK